MPYKHGAFRFAFRVQHGLWQKQGLIKSKIKTNKKIRLREENRTERLPFHMVAKEMEPEARKTKQGFYI